ncbi:PAS domain S-box protein, partial [Verrucomicrobiota bacterium]
MSRPEQTLKMLRQSEDNYRTLVEQCPVGIGLCMPDGKVISMNRAMEKITGYSTEEIKGINLADTYMNLEDRKEIIEALKEHGIVANYQVQLKRKGGISYDALLSMSTVSIGGKKFFQTTCMDITDRKKAERELALFSHASDSSRDGLIITDAKGIISYCNDATAGMCGYGENELIGKHGSVLDGEYGRTNRSIIASVIKTGGWSGEIMARRKDGSLFPISLVNSLIRDKEGQPIGVLGIARDITERKKNERMLSREQSLFQTLMKNPFDFIYFKDQQGRFEHVSDRFCEFFGFRREDIIGKSDVDLFPADVAEETFNEDMQVIRTGKPLINKEENAKGVWVLTTKTPWLDKEGNIIGLFGISRDITKRKKAEEEIRNFQLVVDSASDAIGISTPAGRHIYQNKAMTDMFGLAAEEVNGEAGPPTTVYVDQAVGREVFETIIGGNVWTGEVRMYGKDNSIRYVFLRAFPIKDEAGGIVGLCGVHTDISERKRTEEELRKMQKLESLSVLAKGIAHDFNNMLGVILGNLELAQMHISDRKKALEDLADIRQAVSRATRLTDQLLTFSRSGTPVKELVRLDQLVRESVEFSLSGSGVKAEYELDGNLSSSRVDTGQIGQVIQNLIINAIHAMPDGGTVHIHSENVHLEKGNKVALRGGKYVKLTVRDTGIGIPAEYVAKIFDPFFTTKPDGHGLGLATAYSIVSGHQGCITVESEPGKGSAFEIYLPASSERPLEKGKAEKPITAGHGKILVMDDDKAVRDVVARFLSGSGYDVVLV